ncbi:MAG: sodium:calcium antiporter, partial [Salinigranum sp.]
PEIVIGNVVGSNVANILLVLGLAAVIGRDVRVDRDLMKVDLPLLAGSAAFLVVAVWNSPFTPIEGLLSLGALAVYLHFTISQKDVTVYEVIEDLDEVEARVAGEPIGLVTYGLLAGSLVVVFLGAYAVVYASVGIAAGLGVGAGFVALTALAVGTSLPEIAVSVVSARRGRPALAVGSVLGSNVVNAFGVMGVASLFGELAVPDSVRALGLPTMVLATVLYLFVTQDREVTRWEGATLLFLYAVFILNLFGTV